jgi:ankyrin repeat protein
MGIEIFHQDNLKHNALYFARKNGRKNIIDLLNLYKQDEKKNR